MPKATLTQLWCEGTGVMAGQSRVERERRGLQDGANLTEEE